MNYFSLADLFLVGLALDISGAILLAKGLLLSPRTLSRLNTVWGVGYGQHEDRLHNRVAGEYGVRLLVAGFILQAIGYSLDIGGVPSKTGTDRLIFGLAMAVIAVGVAWATWALRHSRRIEALTAAVEREQPAASQEINAAKQKVEATAPARMNKLDSSNP